RIRDRTMHRCRRSDCGRTGVVECWRDRLVWFFVSAMAPRLADFGSFGGRTEPGTAQPERLKEPVSQQVFPWLASRALHHGAGDRVAAVRVFPMCAGRVRWTSGKQARGQAEALFER